MQSRQPTDTTPLSECAPVRHCARRIACVSNTRQIMLVLTYQVFYLVRLLFLAMVSHTTMIGKGERCCKREAGVGWGGTGGHVEVG